MPCPLLGHIALTIDAALPGGLPPGEYAVRVSGYRGHDVILMDPTSPVYDRMQQALDLISVDEKDLLVWGVECTCARSEMTVCA